MAPGCVRIKREERNCKKVASCKVKYEIAKEETAVDESTSQNKLYRYILILHSSSLHCDIYLAVASPIIPKPNVSSIYWIPSKCQVQGQSKWEDVLSESGLNLSTSTIKYYIVLLCKYKSFSAYLFCILYPTGSGSCNHLQSKRM